MRTGRSRLASRALAMALVLATAAAAAPAALAHTTGTAAWRDSTATKVGDYTAHQMSVTFVLAWRRADALAALLATPHAALRPATFDARFAPMPATVKTVTTWAAKNDLSVTSVSANRALIRLSGSSTQVATALHTQFASFHSGKDGSFFAITKDARLPKSFAGEVTAVVGLSSLSKVTLPPLAHPSATAPGNLPAGTPITLPVKTTIPIPLPIPSTGLATVTGTVTGTATGTVPNPSKLLSNNPIPLERRNAAGSLNYPASYTPQNFWSIYDAPSSQTGGGQQLSIITEGDLAQPKADLAQFEKTYGLSTVTWNQIDVGAQSTDTSGDDEWDLDSQYSTAFAPGVTKLNVYDGPSLNDADILTTINRWVTDDLSKQGSFSAGECDLLAYVSGFTSGLDAVLQQADAQGQTMFFAAGDTGSFCPAVVGVNGVPAGIPDTNYPASSPYGIGAGGTSVLSPSGPTEIAWYAGGGGLSTLEPTPAFQSGVKVLGAAPLATRGVPDVSLDADPESGYDVVVDGTVETIGGTSAGAPSWQGIWARVEGAHSGAVGFAGPVLYKTEPASAFHDITLGANGLYTAGPGYDLVTGLGTPDIAKLISGA